MTTDDKNIPRRDFLATGARMIGAAGLAVGALELIKTKARAEDEVWQIDPDLCIACDHCQTHCVLDVSAVKCVQCFALCGYCDVCTGYFPLEKYYALDTGAENHLCPTNAIVRRFIEPQGQDRFFEYTIKEPLCIGCGKCVVGCRQMNGSLYLQVRHDRCVNCNQCQIALHCPPQAFRRVPATQPNLLMAKARAAVESLQRKRTEDKPRAGDA